MSITVLMKILICSLFDVAYCFVSIPILCEPLLENANNGII